MPYNKRYHYFFVLILSLLLAACSTLQSPFGAISGQTDVSPISLCEAESPANVARALTVAGRFLPRSEADIATLLASMTLQEKVGQMVQTDIAVISPQEAKENHVGSIISLIPEGELGTTEAWRDLADSYQQQLLQTRLGIPLVFGIDAVHGHSYFDGNSVILPHNIGLGATRNPALVKQLAVLTAKELSATGVRWTFSPTIAVARNIRWGRTYESLAKM